MILIVVLILLVVVALACIVVGAAAARRGDLGPHPLQWLLDLRSPSGKRFFPNEEAAHDLLDAIEDPELTGRGPGQRPSV